MLLKLLGEAAGGGTVTVRIGHEGPYQQLSATSVVATGYGPRDEAVARLGIVGPDPDGLPRDDGGGASRRALRLPDPRRGLRRPPSRGVLARVSSPAEPITKEQT